MPYMQTREQDYARIAARGGARHVVAPSDLFGGGLAAYKADERSWNERSDLQKGLTGTVLPTTLRHEVVEFRGAIARVHRTSGLDRLRAELAPPVPTPLQGTSDRLRLLIFSLVYEECLQAPERSCEWGSRAP